MINNNKIIYNSSDNSIKKEEIKCLHQQCTKCKGTGVDDKGRTCFHFIFCPCPKCNPQYL